MDKKRILIIVAHPDDELFSCGGFIIQESKQSVIDVCVVTDKGDRWLKCFKSNCEEMGVNRAVSLDIPLWKNKDVRLLNMFSAEEFNDKLNKALSSIDIYDLIITHNTDGDIDWHDQHIHLAAMVCDRFTNRELRQFVAFPRYRVSNKHRFYSLYKRREWWEPYLLKGFLPIHLANKAKLVYELRHDTVRLKNKLKIRYMGKRDKYPMIHYPMELFA